VLYWLQYDVISFPQIVRQEIRLRSWISEHAITAFVAGFGVYILLSLIPGTTGKSFVFGWLYGFWQALVMVDFALTLAALIAFLFSRYVFLDIVQARLQRFHRWLSAAIERDGAFYLLAVRLMHAPYTLVNYAAGATGVRMRTFWWTTQLGLLPGTIVCVLVGARLPTLAELQDRGFWSLVDSSLIAAMLLIATMPFVIRLAMRWWRHGSIVRQGPAGSP
jgi:uncharacterized membrane protein YdjX (TVP38/TMEM64 family)